MLANACSSHMKNEDNDDPAWLPPHYDWTTAALAWEHQRVWGRLEWMIINFQSMGKHYTQSCQSSKVKCLNYHLQTHKHVCYWHQTPNWCVSMSPSTALTSKGRSWGLFPFPCSLQITSGHKQSGAQSGSFGSL